eukprot:scaffold24756_cov54-Phaeocystis_antarctica.AAC.2
MTSKRKSRERVKDRSRREKGGSFVRAPLCIVKPLKHLSCVSEANAGAYWLSQLGRARARARARVVHCPAASGARCLPALLALLPVCCAA